MLCVGFNLWFYKSKLHVSTNLFLPKNSPKCCSDFFKKKKNNWIFRIYYYFLVWIILNFFITLRWSENNNLRFWYSICGLNADIKKWAVLIYLKTAIMMQFPFTELKKVTQLKLLLIYGRWNHIFILRENITSKLKKQVSSCTTFSNNYGWAFKNQYALISF